jgi:hypothetical protein
LVHIDTEFLGSNVYRQSPTTGQNPEFNPDAPHKVQPVSEQWLSSLAGQCDRTAVSLAEQSHARMFGGSHYGLRLSRGLQTLTLSWAPRFEDQAEYIRGLWALVDGAVEA